MAEDRLQELGCLALVARPFGGLRVAEFLLTYHVLHDHLHLTCDFDSYKTYCPNLDIKLPKYSSQRGGNGFCPKATVPLKLLKLTTSRP